MLQQTAQGILEHHDSRIQVFSWLSIFFFFFFHSHMRSCSFASFLSLFYFWKNEKDSERKDEEED